MPSEAPPGRAATGTRDDGEDRGSPALPERGDDLKVAAAILAGDECVFTELVRRMSPGMLKVAATYVGSHAIAEEVVQETWMSVLRGLSGFQGRASLRTWAFRICVHAATRRAQAEGRSLPFSDAFPDDGPTVDPTRFRPPTERENPGAWATPPRSWSDVPEAVLLSRETAAHLQRAIDELPERQRVVIVLRDVDGYSPGEVCHILDISEGNQRVLLPGAGPAPLGHRDLPGDDMRWRLRPRRTPGLTCQELVELVTDYAEGALSPQQRARFDAHLQACDGCTTYVAQMTESLQITGTLSQENLSQTAETALLEAFRDWHTRPNQ